MKASPVPKIFIYTALTCEAKPIIDFFHLKKDLSIQSFAVYSNRDICLTVTGVGKTAMAAGIAYSQALFSPSIHPILLNIGIAGHKYHPIGSLFLIDKITDSDTDRRYYPPLVFTPPCPTHSLQTVSKPHLAYPSQQLCDMEASAFYETAARFSTSELIQCLKIVSDNELSPIHTIQASQVSALIAAHVPNISSILTTLAKLADSLSVLEFKEFDHLLNRYHFTVNEQLQLKKLLSRWHLVSNQTIPEFADNSPKNSQEFIKLLKQFINKAEFYL
jgi:adenosylhomocysteine nucleosidase